MQYLAIIKTVLSLLPILIQVIKAIEEAIPGTGQGEQKLAMIRSIIESISGEAVELWGYLEKAIGIIVGVFNSTGVFKK